MEDHLAFLCDQAADQATSDMLTTGIIYATLDAADSRSVGFADQVTRNRSNSINHDSTTHVLLIIMTIIGSRAPAQATRPA